MKLRAVLILLVLPINVWAYDDSLGTSALGLADGTANIYYQHRFNFDGAMVVQVSSLRDPSLAKGRSGTSVSAGYKYYSQNYGSGNYLVGGIAVYTADDQSTWSSAALPIFVIGKEWQMRSFIFGIETGLGTISGTSLIGFNLAYELP